MQGFEEIQIISLLFFFERIRNPNYFSITVQIKLLEGAREVMGEEEETK